MAMNNLAMARFLAGQWDEAAALHEKTLKLCEAKLGRDNLTSLRMMLDLAREFGVTERRNDAVPLLEEVVKRYKTRLGSDHMFTEKAMDKLAAAYFLADRFAEAEIILREMLSKIRQNHAADSREIDTLKWLGKSLARQGKYAEAEPVLGE